MKYKNKKLLIIVIASQLNVFIFKSYIIILNTFRFFPLFFRKSFFEKLGVKRLISFFTGSAVSPPTHFFLEEDIVKIKINNFT